MTTSTPLSLPTIGHPIPAEGGTLGAIIALPRPAGTHIFGVIVADLAHEIAPGQWGEYGTKIPGADSGTDGLANTNAMAAAGNALAAQVRALRVGGFDDWHLPSRFVARALAEFAPQLFSPHGWYWTSTQCSAHYAWMQDFDDGNSIWDAKDYECRARPVRLIQLPHFSLQNFVAAGDSAAIFSATPTEAAEVAA